MEFKKRYLRIFSSSTFSDMHAERDILLNRVFTRLEREFKKRQIVVDVIDLRWGITKSQAESGKTLEICLREIEKAKETPIFFIGMLGDRYGWDSWNKEEKFLHFLKQNNKYEKILQKSTLGISATELEMEYAFFDNSQNYQNRAFLYFRESKLSKSVHLENYIADETAEKKIKLHNLKEKIKQSNIVSYTYYRSFQSFEDKVYQQLFDAVNTLFPYNQTPSKLEYIRNENRTFASSRKKVYIPSKEYQEILDDFMHNDQNNKLLIYGESGIGKSTLIANYLDYLRDNSDYFIIERYIGLHDSGDLKLTLWGVLLELEERFSLENNFDIEKIEDEFELLLKKIPPIKILIVFDGLNQLKDGQWSKLEWISKKLPQHVKFIVSTINPLKRLKNFKVLKVKFWNLNQKSDFIDIFLKNNYGKELEYKDYILNQVHTKNPLFFKTLLNELRLYGDFENLKEQLQWYLEAKTPIELFNKVFQRLEDVYNHDSNELVQKVLSLLYVSREGLSENNIIDILNWSGENITQYLLSPLIFAIDEHLINKDGYLSFFHSYIYDAVKLKYTYLHDDSRKLIIDFFSTKEINRQEKFNNFFDIDKPSQQIINELPYQLLVLGNKELLQYWLLNIMFFTSITNLERIKYLEFIGKENDFFSLLNIKLKQLKTQNREDKKKLFLILIQIGIFTRDFMSVQNYRVSKKILEKSLYLANELKLFDLIVIAKLNLAQLYYRKGNTGEYLLARNYYIELMKILEEKNDENQLKMVYKHLAYLYFKTTSNYKLAVTLYLKSIKIIKNEKINNEIELVEVYNLLSLVFLHKGYYCRVKILHCRILSVYQNYYEPREISMANIYNNISGYHYRTKSYRKSIYFCLKALNIRKRSLSRTHIDTATSYQNLAMIIMKEYLINQNAITQELKRRYILTLEKLFKVSHQSYIALFTENNKAVFTSFINQNLFLTTIKKDYKQAKHYLNKAEKILSEIIDDKNHEDYASLYRHLSEIHFIEREYKTSLKYIDKTIKIYIYLFGLSNHHTQEANDFKEKVINIFQDEKNR